MDREDVVVLVGVLVIALGIYLQFGGAMAMVFVGVVLVVAGLVMALWAGPSSGKR